MMEDLKFLLHGLIYMLAILGFYAVLRFIGGNVCV